MLKITDENEKQLKSEAKSYGYDVSKRKIGGQRVPCVLVPAGQAVHDAIYKTEDAEQKRRVRGKRPMVPNGKGKLKRCPTVIPNPEYHGQEGVTKTIKNDCTKCQYYATCDWWKDNQQESMDGAEEAAGDASEVMQEVSIKKSTGIMPNDDRFQKARTDILAMIGNEYPEYYDTFDMLLSGESRNAVVEAEKQKENGLSKSNVYNLPKDLMNALCDLFDDLLWYIDADVSKFRK